jgi:hypothetical protein
MLANNHTSKAGRLSEKVRIIGLVCVVLSLAGVALAAFCPLGRGLAESADTGNSALPPLPRADRPIQPLLVKMAGRRLIRPSQAQAAVKDSGLTGRLAKKLTLQGIVRVGGTLVAYIHVEKQGVKSVRAGDRILDFLVERMESDRVTLSLEGVQVVLKH